MTEDDRSDRTAKLLIGRLEALVHAAARLPHAETQRLVELATVATMRAVALDLIAAERADAIWQDAHRRHPALRRADVAVDVPRRLAA